MGVGRPKAPKGVSAFDDLSAPPFGITKKLKYQLLIFIFAERVERYKNITLAWAKIFYTLLREEY
jgi:hypothetical protein